MAEDKKQKVMLAVLGVLIVGMGSYWFVFRDSGPQTVRDDDNQTAERKRRERKAPEETTSRRRAREAPEQTVERASRREKREVRERPSVDRRRRKVGRKKKKKKKLTAPAAMIIPGGLPTDFQDETGISLYNERFLFVDPARA